MSSGVELHVPALKRIGGANFATRVVLLPELAQRQAAAMPVAGYPA